MTTPRTSYRNKVLFRDNLYHVLTDIEDTALDKLNSLSNITSNLEIINSGINSNLVAINSTLSGVLFITGRTQIEAYDPLSGYGSLYMTNNQLLTYDSNTHTRLDNVNNSINSNLTTINSSIQDLDINNSGINSNLTTINSSIQSLDINNTGINSNLTTINSSIQSLDINNTGINSNLTTINDTMNTNNTAIYNTLYQAMPVIAYTNQVISNNTPKTLRQYRSEGKCYGATYTFTAGSGNNLYINNPDGSNKVIYIYNIDITTIDAATLGRSYSDIKFVDGNITTLGSNIDYTNIKPYETLSNSYWVGSDGTTTNNTSILGSYYTLVTGVGGILDFQEEWLELSANTAIIIYSEDEGGACPTAINVRFIIDDA